MDMELPFFYKNIRFEKMNFENFLLFRKEMKLEPMEIVQKYTVDFHKVLDLFNLLPPNIEPTATGHIVEQIELTEKLIEKVDATKLKILKELFL